MRANLESVGFWALAAVAAAFLVLLGGVMTGHFVADPEAEETLSVAAQTNLASDPLPTEEMLPASSPSPAAEPARRNATVVLRAARGDCWVEAREGGSDGRIIYFQLLPAGETARLSARRIWLSLGAAHNLDATVDGKRRRLGSGLVTIQLG